jgi:RHS repeat-associated protein
MPDGTVASYKYDPLGRRIEKAVTVNASLITLHYVYDNEDIVAVLDGNNNVVSNFTHGPGIDEPLIMKSSTSENYYYHADGLGSITALTNDAGTIAETIEYQAYGKAVIKDGTGVGIDKSTIDNTYLFTAREFDSETGMYYFRARYYNVNSGRFVQEDHQVLDAGGNAAYLYVGAAPTNYIDPSGHIMLLFDPSYNMMNVYDNAGNYLQSYEAHNAAGGKGYWPAGVYGLGVPRGPRDEWSDEENIGTGRWFIPAKTQPKGRSDLGIHGGGSCAEDPYAPTQTWCSTLGCIRVQNRDLEGLARFILNDVARGVSNILIIFPRPGETWPAGKGYPHIEGY